MLDLTVVKVLKRGSKVLIYECVSTQETYYIPRDMLIEQLQKKTSNVRYVNVSMYIRKGKPCIVIPSDVPRETYKVDSSEDIERILTEINSSKSCFEGGKNVPFDSRVPFVDFVLDVIEANEDLFMRLSKNDRRSFILGMRFQ